MKHIVLCADDYGQAPAISNAILVLLQKERLSAVSCLTTASDWPAHATWLAPYRDQVDIGLHFNLTEGQPLSAAYIRAYGPSFSSLNTWIARVYLRRVDQAALIAECLAQIDHFYNSCGYMPCFIDGHQHVHQFPQVREALLTAYRARLQATGAYIRVAKPTLTWRDLFKAPKKWIIYAMGGYKLGQLLSQAQIPHNSSFSGSYGFNVQDYRAQFKQFLAEIKQGGIIMCHPGLPTIGSTDDAISHARAIEFDYFSSDEYLADCRSAQVRLAKFKAIF